MSNLFELDFKLLFQMQDLLDKRIIDEKELKHRKSFLNEKVLALLVELAEFSNEHKSFKFWKKDKKVIPDDLIEEFVDGIHFFLSISNEKGWSGQVERDLRKFYQPLKPPIAENYDRVNVLSIDLFHDIATFWKTGNRSDFVHAFYKYLVLGMSFEFSKEQVMKSYEKKNQMNHQRIEMNY